MTTGFSRLRREDLLKTACEVIAELGFGNARTLDIARAAGVSQALLFYHFESKERLFAQAFGYAARLHLNALIDVEQSTGAPLERLRTLLRLCSPATPTEGWRLWIDAWGEAMRSSELEQISRRIDARGRLLMRAIIESGVASGEFECHDPDAAAWRIFALIDGLAIQMHVHPKVLSRRRVNALIRAAAASELGLDAEKL
ncbi:TetR family transcriptional regulator C-terminal domain-containing protein [Nonomuraea sp. K274]|uniref:TetR family transcriptional regulator C-terminal domain-containing protein n=1 Tax=Nonomuraea cypriaca TaxID=1187855 RepID=A0A931AC46_9ACTN|nr:TetR family transcriptional regulator C-terminal domain-containing protein [Nonomuraea cypriaca]MBF8189148.1 TetR family transcriptional regulator C-terminal domain-containing protein [Nonomuraea cypriaca]